MEWFHKKKKQQSETQRRWKVRQKKHQCHFGAGCKGRAAWDERRVSFCIRNDSTPRSVSQDTHIDLIQLHSATPDRTQVLLLTQVQLCQEETEKLELLE